MLSDGLLPVWHQAITCTNANLLWIGPNLIETTFSEIWIKIQIISVDEIHVKMSIKCWPFSCSGLNVSPAPWPILLSQINFSKRGHWAGAEGVNFPFRFQRCYDCSAGDGGHIMIMGGAPGSWHMNCTTIFNNNLYLDICGHVLCNHRNH